MAEPNLKADDAIKAKVKELTDGITDEYEKMRQIFFFVAQQIRYLGVPIGDKEGIEPHPAALTFERREGVCKDKATLLATMLNEAGIKSWVTLSNPIGKVYKQVAASQFMHMITGARLSNGKVYYLDSTDEFCRDLLPAYSYNKEYLPCLPDGSDLKHFPIQPPEKNSELIKIKSHINENGKLNATINYKLSGIYDELWRTILKQLNSAETDQFFEKLVKEINPACQLDSYRVVPKKPGDLNYPVRVSITVSCEDYAIAAEPYLFFKPVGYTSSLALLSRFIKRYTTITKRNYPVDMLFTLMSEVEEEIEVPASFKVELLPKQKKVKNKVGKFEVKFVGKNKLNLISHFEISQSYIEPNEYPSLRELYQTSNTSKKGFVFLVKEEKK